MLIHIQSFFNVLTNPAREGRFFYTTTSNAQDTKLKYLLLDPSEHFREVVEDARAVILAGGTMSPVRTLERPVTVERITDCLDGRLHTSAIPVPELFRHCDSFLWARHSTIKLVRQPSVTDTGGQRI